MKLKIKNYQRLEDIELNLVSGINLISGNSNNGKSSTIRAVRDFIFNKLSNDKIRHGEDQLSITLNETEAIRTTKGTTYNIGNEKLEKVGRNQLPEIIDKFNISELKINGVSIKPNFSFQMDKPFLFDKTAGQKNDLIIGTKNNKYIKALKNIKSEQLELSKVTKKSLEETIDTLKKNNLDKKNKILKLNGIEELVKKINIFEKQTNDFQELYKSYINLKEYNNNSQKLKNKFLKINKLKYGHIYDLNSKIIEQKDIIKLLYDNYQKYKELLSYQEELKNKIDKLSGMLSNKDSIMKLINESIELENKYIELDNIKNNFNQAVFNENKLENNFKCISIKLDEEKTKFEEFKEKLGICPLCGGKL